MRTDQIGALEMRLEQNHALVLDVGCGNGAFTAAFAAHPAIAHVVGADLSPEMLHAARRRVGDGVAFIRADATALPLRASRFDLVFMSHVLQLVPDIDGCAAEVVRSLTPGGVLAATVGTGGSREMARQFLSADEWQNLTALFEPGQGRFAADDQTRIAAACARVALAVEWRNARFSVTWPALEEWVRIRWLTIADDAQRDRAEQWLAQVRARAEGLTLPFSETVLVARKLSSHRSGRTSTTY